MDQCRPAFTGSLLHYVERVSNYDGWRRLKLTFIEALKPQQIFLFRVRCLTMIPAWPEYFVEDFPADFFLFLVATKRLLAFRWLSLFFLLCFASGWNRCLSHWQRPNVLWASAELLEAWQTGAQQGPGRRRYCLHGNWDCAYRAPLKLVSFVIFAHTHFKSTTLELCRPPLIFNFTPLENVFRSFRDCFRLAALCIDSVPTNMMFAELWNRSRSLPTSSGAISTSLHS